MRIVKKIFSIIVALFIVFIIGVIILYNMYCSGVFGVQDVAEVNDHICVSIKLTKNANNQLNADSEMLYGSGFFITPNRVVCINTHLPDGYDVEIRDMDKNTYKIIDKKIYDNITIFKTEKSNNSIKYLYSVAKENDIVNVHITSNNYINDLSKCRIVNDRYNIGSSKNIICEGQIEGKSSHPVIDEYGRIAGITWANDSEKKCFFAYTTYDILKNNMGLIFGVNR